MLFFGLASLKEWQTGSTCRQQTVASTVGTAAKLFGPRHLKIMSRYLKLLAYFKFLFFVRLSVILSICVCVVLSDSVCFCLSGIRTNTRRQPTCWMMLWPSGRRLWAGTIQLWVHLCLSYIEDIPLCCVFMALAIFFSWHWYDSLYVYQKDVLSCITTKCSQVQKKKNHLFPKMVIRSFYRTINMDDWVYCNKHFYMS